MESGGNKLLNIQAADEGGPDSFISNSGKGKQKIDIDPNVFGSNVQDDAENETQKELSVPPDDKDYHEAPVEDLGIKSVKETKQFSQTKLEAVKSSARQSNTNHKRKLPRKGGKPGKLKKVPSCHPNGRSDYQHDFTRPPSPALSQDQHMDLSTSSQSLVSNHFGRPDSDQREVTVQQQELTVDQRKKSQTEEENTGLEDVTTEETQDKATFQQPPTPDPSQSFKQVSLTTELAAPKEPLCNVSNLFALGMITEDNQLPMRVRIKDKLRKKILSKTDNQHAVTRPPSPAQSQDKPIYLSTSSQSVVSNDFGRPDGDQREVTVQQQEVTVDQRKKSQTEEENTDLDIKSVKETKQFSQTELESAKSSGRQSNTNHKRKLPRNCCTTGKLTKVSSCHPNGQSDYQHAVTRPPSPAQSQDKPIYLTTSSQSLVSNYFGTPNSDQREFTVQQQEVTVDQRKKSQTEEENKGLQDVTTEETQDKATFQQPPTPDPSQPFKHVSLTTGLAAQEKPLCNLPNLFALGIGEDFPLPNIVGIKDKLRKKILSKK